MDGIAPQAVKRPKTDQVVKVLSTIITACKEDGDYEARLNNELEHQGVDFYFRLGKPYPRDVGQSHTSRLAAMPRVGRKYGPGCRTDSYAVS